MKDRLRLGEKLTYSNVVSTICLFLLLGGGAAYAAGHLGRNSVGNKQIKKNAVTTAKIKKEAVTAAKVKKGTLTGAQIKTSTLGTVPTATNATSAANAQTLGGLSATQLTDASKVRCPAGTQSAAGVCFETASRSADELYVAMTLCARDDRRLPSQNELMAFALKFSVAPPGEWAEPMFVDTVNKGALIASSIANPVVNFEAASVSHPYRCVVGASN